MKTCGFFNVWCPLLTSSVLYYGVSPDREEPLVLWWTGRVTLMWMCDTVSQSTTSTACMATQMRRTKLEHQSDTTSGVI